MDNVLYVHLHMKINSTTGNIKQTSPNPIYGVPVEY